jgi:hypothetical protein
MLLVTGMCSAENRQSFLCTGEGQTKYVTGLGSGIDDLIHIPKRFRSEVRTAQNDGWKFAYGTAAFTDREKKMVNIIRGASETNMASQVSHEIGHANYVPHYDYSSRDAYVRSACTDEGRAVLENVHAYHAFKTCAAIDVGLITAEPATILAKYEELAEYPPIKPADIGLLFCEKNINSVTHQNYLDYYGDWWDANYGKEDAVPSAEARDDAFWATVEDLADRAARSATDLLAVWPSVMSSAPAEGSKVPLSRYGGGGPLSGDRWMGKGEIRTSSDDPERVGIAYFVLQGRCLSLSAVRARYPGAALTGIPHSPLPDETTVWSAFGKWGKLSFAFANGDRDCVGQISMDPYPAPSPSESQL